MNTPDQFVMNARLVSLINPPPMVGPGDSVDEKFVRGSPTAIRSSDVGSESYSRGAMAVEEPEAVYPQKLDAWVRMAIIIPNPPLRRTVAAMLRRSGYLCTQLCEVSDLEAFRDRREPFNLLAIASDSAPKKAADELADAVRVLGGVPTIFLARASQLHTARDFLSAGKDNEFALLTAHDEDLSLRLESFVRRSSKQEKREIAFGAYRFLPKAKKVILHGEEIVLSPHQFELALCLFRNCGKVVSRQQLRSWLARTASAENSRSLDTNMSKLRRVLRLNESASLLTLRSVYGEGYMLDCNEA